MPLADPTAWVSQQQLNQIPGQPPPEVIAAMQGRYDPSVHQWNPQTMTLTGPEGEYYFGGDSYNPYEANPANGTNVVIDGVTQNFAEGVTPYTFLGGGQAQTVAEGSPEYHALRDDARTRNQQGLARIATLVGGGAALGATGSGPVFGGSGAAGTTAAQTFPYTTGGPVTVSSIPGVTAGTTAAGVAGATGAGGAGAAGGGGAAASTAQNFFSNAENWLPYVTTGINTLLGTRAADQAADAEIEALREGIAEQRRQYDTTRSDWAPWLDAGRTALGRLSDPNAYTASPEYEGLRTEGIRDIGNTFSARGGGQSGNALRRLAEYTTELAARDRGSWFNQQATIAGLGTTGTNAVTNAGTNTAGTVSNYLADTGASRASGVMGKYGSVANGLSEGVTNWLYRRRRAA